MVQHFNYSSNEEKILIILITSWNWKYLLEVWMWLVSCRRQKILILGAYTRFKVQVEYFIIPCTIASIRLSNLGQGYHDHFVVTANGGEMRKV